MAIHDTSPERRNLIVLSLSIIIFYLAGGVIDTGGVRLQGVNVRFTRPEVLGYFVWSLLVWFYYRYWLVHQGQWKEELRQELMNSSKYGQFIYYRYLVRRFKIPPDRKPRRSSRHDVYFTQDNLGVPLKFGYRYARAIVPDKPEAGTQTAQDLRDIETLADKLVVGLVFLYMFFRRPSLSTYFVPYLLFFAAITLGICDKV